MHLRHQRTHPYTTRPLHSQNTTYTSTEIPQYRPTTKKSLGKISPTPSPDRRATSSRPYVLHQSQQQPSLLSIQRASIHSCARGGSIAVRYRAAQHPPSLVRAHRRTCVHACVCLYTSGPSRKGVAVRSPRRAVDPVDKARPSKLARPREGSPSVESRAGRGHAAGTRSHLGAGTCFLRFFPPSRQRGF